ncbi:LPXTG cell wall anchor domain-containing protein [Corynebacterium sp. H130]|uniref:LPXTG cell wall anchor domain-containing protein n=1 Tax=Corynebacterium sp. H130 TaxID=3133444 RepID=UPI0030B34374
MKRIATSVTALAVAGAMTLAVLPAAQAESTTNGSSFSYSIEGIAGSLQQFSKLSPELQAEIRAAIEAQDLLKLVQLKVRVDAELAKIEAAEQGTNAADAKATSGSSALSSVLADGISVKETTSATATTAATTVSSAPTSTSASASATAEAGSSANKIVENLTAGSSSKADSTAVTPTAEPASSSDEITAGSSAISKADINWEAALGFGGLALAALSFGSMLSSDGQGSSNGSSAGSSEKKETKKEEVKKEHKAEGKGGLEGEVAAKGKDAKHGDVAGAGKRGVLAATGDNTAARAIAGILLALIAVAGFVARRKFVTK